MFRKKRNVEADNSQRRVRVDERTKNLTKRLEAGEIAVIDHVDLDRVSAEALVRCKPYAVLNAAKSTSGRYPNLGPQILLDAGIPLIDDLGSDVMQLKEGQFVRIEENNIYCDDKLVASGQLQTPQTVAEAMEEARSGLSAQIEAFAANTMEYMRREKDLLLDGVGVPQIKTDLRDKHILVVVRGYNYKEDLATLRPYIREYKPILVGVDGGADAILEAGLKPDMIVGDMDSVSDKALTCGAEIVVHAYRNGKAPGLERVEALDVDYVVFPATGTSEDVAMLLGDENGAELIVAVGTHVTLIEFLDKGRAGMASTFLTRLRVGSKLVDAKGVSKLYRSRISSLQIAFLIFAGLLALSIAIIFTPFGQALLGIGGAWVDTAVNFLRGLVGLAPQIPTT